MIDNICMLFHRVIIRVKLASKDAARGVDASGQIQKLPCVMELWIKQL